MVGMLGLEEGNSSEEEVCKKETTPISSPRTPIDKLIIREKQRWNVNMVILQETKFLVINSTMSRTPWNRAGVELAYQPSIGASGGLCIMWRGEEFELLDRHDGVYSLAFLFKLRRTGQIWYSVGVYAPNNRKDIRILWRELGDIVGLWDFPGCIRGDFNTILFTEEKNRDCTINRGMSNFTKFIMDWNLIDLPLCGAIYTWTNGQVDPIFCRLDRFLINSRWEELFPDTIQSTKPRPVSDHTPILLITQGLRFGPSFYKFEHIWLEDPSLKDKITGWWNEFQVEGNPGYVL
ncbi:uncharacterized protein LOC113272071 [Papaver somniferum]|uniref:uncharacterized protein LOC113272071 n=1 Tax=Papaver somniferum TaxID=3469 RepID=UPI000E6FBF33|nr:uncharacterized protein LOC113272071 [Papaver somniferum]